MTEHEAQGWAGVLQRYPEAAWAGVTGVLVLFAATNFAWWRIELPDLVNAHNDTLLLAAFVGSFGLIVFDAVLIVRAVRGARRIRAVVISTRSDDDEQA